MDDKIYYPETIDDNPLPSQITGVSFSDSPGKGEVTGPNKIKDQGVPYKRVAVELIGSALNTKSRKILAEFEFTESGALQIGKYTNGVSGDLRITPNGITARDKSGLTTFAIDGSTGNAVFKGTIQANSLISGLVVVGDNRVVIDGANARMLVNDKTNDRVLIGYHEGGF